MGDMELYYLTEATKMEEYYSEEIELAELLAEELVQEDIKYLDKQ